MALAYTCCKGGLGTHDQPTGGGGVSCPVSSWKGETEGRARGARGQKGGQPGGHVRAQATFAGDEEAVWRRTVTGAGGNSISLPGIWQFIRDVDGARRAGDEGAQLREALRRKLHQACGGPAEPRALPRRHGLAAWRDWRKDGTLIVAHLPQRVLQFGNERRARELVEMDAALAEEEAEDMGFSVE